MKKKYRKVVTFWGGVALVCLGVVDGIIDPFRFITAPELIGSGIALIAASQAGSDE